MKTHVLSCPLAFPESTHLAERCECPPDACWLCGHALGSDAQCLMCDAYRKDTAPKPYDAALDPDRIRATARAHGALATVPHLNNTEKP